MGETKWTKEQSEAIYTRRCNLLVAAAAGSGKTAVLVERIIQIITNEKNPVDIDKVSVSLMSPKTIPENVLSLLFLFLLPTAIIDVTIEAPLARVSVPFHLFIIAKSYALCIINNG